MSNILKSMAQKNKAKPDIDKVMTVSTAHLSEETRTLMEDPEFLNNTLLAIYPKTAFGQTFGWYVYTLYDLNDDETIPDDLRTVMQYAKDAHCKLVCFDRDHATCANLKTYE